MCLHNVTVVPTRRLLHTRLRPTPRLPHDIGFLEFMPCRFLLSAGGTQARRGRLPTIKATGGHLWRVDRQRELTAIFLAFRDYVAGGTCPSKATVQGKTVIVTGANTGIGKQTALELARRGEGLGGGGGSVGGGGRRGEGTEQRKGAVRAQSRRWEVRQREYSP